MISEIKYKKDTLAYIIKNTNKNGVNFATPKKLAQQVGILNHKKGHKINPHVHLKNIRLIKYTTEVLIIIKGKLKVNFYNNHKKYLFSKILYNNNIIIFIKGGHGFEILEDSKIIEVKQGPYNQINDKVLFD